MSRSVDQRGLVTSNSWITDCTADKGQSKPLFFIGIYIFLSHQHTLVNEFLRVLQVNVFTQYPDINLQLQSQKEGC